MYTDEVNETGHRRRQEPGPPGPDSFGGATRVGEGWGVESKRADQLVLRDVGYDNNWRRKLQTIRESASSSFDPHLRESALSDAIACAFNSLAFPPPDDLGCPSRPPFVVNG